MNWDEFDSNLRKSLSKIRGEQRLFDVTLVTDDGQHIQAHKLILSAGSQFFSDIFLKCNQANMLIYLKGIRSVQLERILDFLYNGEASAGQDEIEEFLKTGKELQVKGLEVDISDVGEDVEEEPERYSKVNKEVCEYRDNIIICDPLEPASYSEKHFENVAIKQMNREKILKLENANGDLDLQITQMIEKSDGVWKCKLCGKINANKSHLREHAESHIDGMSHACHICNRILSTRKSLRGHINDYHSVLLSCDLCGKSGMNKVAYYRHKKSHHR